MGTGHFITSTDRYCPYIYSSSTEYIDNSNSFYFLETRSQKKIGYIHKLIILLYE